MGADHHRRATGDLFQGAGAGLALELAGQPGGFDAQGGQPALEIDEVLFGEDLGRCHQCHLIARFQRLQGGQGGDHGLARANIALDQPQHRFGLAEVVGLGQLMGEQLFEGQAVLGPVMAEGEFFDIGIGRWLVQVADRIVQGGQLVVAGQFPWQPVRQAARPEHGQALLAQQAQALLGQAFGQRVDRGQGLVDRRRLVTGQGTVFRVIDFQSRGAGPGLAVAAHMGAALETFLLGVAEMIEAQAQPAGAVIEPYQQAATLAHDHIGTADHAFDHRVLAGAQGTDGDDTGPVLVAQGQVKQYILDGFQADLGQLLGHGFADTLECRDGHLRQLSHGIQLAGGDHVADGFQGTGLDRGVLGRVAALGQRRAGFENLVAEAVAFAEQQQALVVEQGAVDGVLAGPGVRGRHQHVERLVVQRQGQHIGLVERQGDDHGVQFTVTQLVAQDVGEVFLDVQRHLRGDPVQLRDQVREQVGANGVDRTDFQRRGQLVFPGLGQFTDALGLFQDLLGLGDDAFANRCQAHGALAALEDQHAEFVFQLFHAH